MALTSASYPTKRRILTVCVKLFLEKGYKRTTLAEILQKAEVSSSSFQNIFGAKDGVLTELAEFMFGSQFSSARLIAGESVPPVYVYAVETAIQLTLTELNENLREIYTEAYSQAGASEYIFQQTAREIESTFAAYLPDLSSRDFFDLEIGSAGIMRAYMARRCTDEFPLQQKLRCFLSMSLRAYCVPEDELQAVLAYIDQLDIRTIAEQVMQKLFRALALRYEFTLNEN